MPTTGWSSIAGVARDSQKFANIARDPRVSLAIAKDVPQPLQIKGLSIAARVEEVTDPGERDHASDILLARYPEYKVMPRPDPRAVPTHAADAGDRVGAGLFERLRPQRLGEGDRCRSAEFVEARRHHWAGFTPFHCRRERGRIATRVPFSSFVPRKNSSALIGCRPARCNS